MNTIVYDLRDLIRFIWDGSKNYKRLQGVHIRAKGSLGSFIKKKKNNTKSRKFKIMKKRANFGAGDSFMTFQDTRKGMLGLLIEKGKYTSFSLC